MVEFIGFGVLLLTLGILGALPIDAVLRFFGLEEE